MSMVVAKAFTTWTTLYYQPAGARLESYQGIYRRLFRVYHRRLQRKGHFSEWAFRAVKEIVIALRAEQSEKR
jgi:hypothetical protein